MTDPNWLLATMAQSAAALVAIVGGFLVSRLIEETQQAFEHFERGGDMPGPSVTDREVYKVYQAVNAARSDSPRFSRKPTA